MVDTACRSYLLYSLSMDQGTSVMELNGQVKWNSMDELKEAQSNLADMTKNRLMVAFDSNKGPILKVVKWC